ncbi:ABC transporter ATP-binding protein [Methylocella sp. CPCC 101449]|uniref:ABC transporter ATP-binding protein n=1 Tax=Methylocella sp. CPCC 101449 TaxID=2987531 RepID=UPI0028909BC1|nr:ABC transporter ATP-binding protein [Methylocella sp. CPCC 101449]MDT2024182.1 ABC transporter ATP-binding protein [Methylocella sp. CPCC 101449]
MTTVLETRALCKKFGGITATDNVTFKLPAGARHALIGPNGAGKTTFVNQLSGVLLPTSGSIFLNGQDVTEWTVRARSRAGLARTFQINQLFADLTPLQSIVIAINERENAARSWFLPFGTRKDLVAEAVELAESLNLGDVLDERVGSLAYGKQRLLEIAIALAAKPTVLLLDEPAAGVPESERDQILNVVAALPASVSLVLIEHDMDLVFRFAKTISVLVNGALFVEGTAEEIAKDPRVRQVYLGEEEISHG